MAIEMICGAWPSPIAAGSLPASVVLSASPAPGSGTVTHYLWTLRSKPPGSAATLGGDAGSEGVPPQSTAASPTLVVDMPGETYIVDLVVRDNAGAVSTGGAYDGTLTAALPRSIPEAAKYKVRTQSESLGLSKPAVDERDWLADGLWAWLDALDELHADFVAHTENADGVFDEIDEATLDHGVDVDGVLLKDGTVTTAPYTSTPPGLKFDRARAVTPAHGMVLETSLGGDKATFLAEGGPALDVVGEINASTDIVAVREVKSLGTMTSHGRLTAPWVQTGQSYLLYYLALQDGDTLTTVTLERPAVQAYIPERAFLEVLEPFNGLFSSTFVLGIGGGQVRIRSTSSFLLNVVVDGIGTAESVTVDETSVTFAAATDGAGAATSTLADFVTALNAEGGDFGIIAAVVTGSTQVVIDYTGMMAESSYSYTLGTAGGAVDGLLSGAALNLYEAGYLGTLTANKGALFSDEGDQIVPVSDGALSFRFSVEGGWTLADIGQGKLAVHTFLTELPAPPE